MQYLFRSYTLQILKASTSQITSVLDASLSLFAIIYQTFTIEDL